MKVKNIMSKSTIYILQKVKHIQPISVNSDCA